MPWLVYSVGFIVCGVLAWIVLGGFRPGVIELSMTPRGDNTFILGYIKGYIEGYGFRFNRALGYPGVQDHVLHPSFDFSYRLFMWLVTRWIKDPFTAYAWVYVAGVAAMYVAAVASLRHLRIHPVLAVIGAVVFVVSPYFAVRAFGHDFLALYYGVPLGAALALRTTTVLDRQDIVRTLREPFVAIAIIVCGTSGLYYSFFTCVFAAFAGTVWSIAKRTWSPLVFALSASFLMVALLAVTGLGFDGIIDTLTGSVRVVRRYATEQIMYGLRMADVAGVFGSLPGLGRLLNEYQGLVRHTGEGRFEFPGIVVTLIILASPLLLASLGASQAADDENDHRWRTTTFMACACIVFGVFYAIPGGIGYIVGVFVFSAIRATQRIVPFLTFFALVVMLSSIEMVLRSSRSRLARLAVAVLTVALLAGMIPMLRNAPEARAVFVANPARKTSVAGIHELLQAKNRNGVTAVLQLPHIAWPEQPSVRDFHPYDHFLGFLYDPSPSKTRWSYGSHLTQPTFGKLKSTIEAHRDAGLVGAAAVLGFDAILVEKAAYDEHERKSLRANIERDIAPSCVIFEDTMRILYLIAREAGGQPCRTRS